MPLTFWVIMALIFIIELIVHLSKIKCPECKKRKVTEISCEELRSEEILFKEKEIIREYKNTGNFRTNAGMRVVTNPYLNHPPERVTTRMVNVPGKRIWYLVGYKCNCCGKIFYRQKHIDKKPIVVK